MRRLHAPIAAWASSHWLTLAQSTFMVGDLTDDDGSIGAWKPQAADDSASMIGAEINGQQESHGCRSLEVKEVDESAGHPVITRYHVSVQQDAARPTNTTDNGHLTDTAVTPGHRRHQYMYSRKTQKGDLHVLSLLTHTHSTRTNQPTKQASKAQASKQGRWTAAQCTD